MFTEKPPLPTIFTSQRYPSYYPNNAYFRAEIQQTNRPDQKHNLLWRRYYSSFIEIAKFNKIIYFLQFHIAFFTVSYRVRFRPQIIRVDCSNSLTLLSIHSYQRRPVLFLKYNSFSQYLGVNRITIRIQDPIYDSDQDVLRSGSCFRGVQPLPDCLVL